MRTNHRQFRWLNFAVFALLGLLLILLPPVAAQAQGGGQSGSLNATDIDGLFTIVLVMAVAVFTGVTGLLLFAVIRYRRKSDDEMPVQVHGNNRLELSLTGLSALIVLVLFFFTLGFYSLPRQTIPADALQIEVTGKTWAWDFYYPEYDLLATVGDTVVGEDIETVQANFRPPTIMRVPAGRPVVLSITSNDVQHSFWVPDLAGKVDAIPGRVQQMWFQVDEPRTYIGQCAEFCGREHYNMMIRIEVLPPEDFTAWVEGRVAEREAVQAALAADPNYPLTLLAEADPDVGRQLFNTNGCAGCHSLAEGVQLVGPSLSGLGARAADRAVEAGLESPELYLLHAITQPNEYVVAGFSQGLMPQNFADILSPQDLADLIAYLQQQ